MTEAEWSRAERAWPMLEFLQRTASRRKLRLFAVGNCRRIWHLLTDQCRAAVEVAEGMADGNATGEEINVAWTTTSTLAESTWDDSAEAACAAVSSDAFAAAELATEMAISAIRAHKQPGVDDDAVNRSVCAMLRCVLGNPFCAATVDPRWLTWNNSTVRHLAEAIYDDRAFDRLPILADALEDAGCHDAAILAHCRSGGEHVRGCWVVDLLLGKE